MNDTHFLISWIFFLFFFFLLHLRFHNTYNVWRYLHMNNMGTPRVVELVQILTPCFLYLVQLGVNLCEHIIIYTIKDALTLKEKFQVYREVSSHNWVHHEQTLGCPKNEYNWLYKCFSHRIPDSTLLVFRHTSCNSFVVEKKKSISGQK